MITIINRQRKIAIDIKDATIKVEKMVEVLGYKDFDVNILFTTNASIKKFNKQFRHKDKPTDILSFPYHANIKPGQRIKPKTIEDKTLGDIIISVEYTKKVAAELKIPLQQHLIRLLAHGIAHLLNYDHHTDAQFKAMDKVEKKLNLLACGV
jgi:rRNA maturation RNase YbeY